MLEFKGTSKIVINQSLWRISGAIVSLTLVACQQMTLLSSHYKVVYPVGKRKPYVCLLWATCLSMLSMHQKRFLSKESCRKVLAVGELWWKPSDAPWDFAERSASQSMWLSFTQLTEEDSSVLTLLTTRHMITERNLPIHVKACLCVYISHQSSFNLPVVFIFPILLRSCSWAFYIWVTVFPTLFKIGLRKLSEAWKK